MEEQLQTSSSIHQKEMQIKLKDQYWSKKITNAFFPEIVQPLAVVTDHFVIVFIESCDDFHQLQVPSTGIILQSAVQFVQLHVKVWAAQVF